MVIAADYPFMNLLWSMIIFFAWVAWIWILIVILTDVFRRHDIGGWTKALWTIFLVVIPFLGVLVYLVAPARRHGRAPAEGRAGPAGPVRRATCARRPARGGGAASEIEKAKALLDSGAITQSEFDSLKAKAVA